MGLWGAAQGIAFGLGGLAGTAASDLAPDRVVAMQSTATEKSAREVVPVSVRTGARLSML